MIWDEINHLSVLFFGVALQAQSHVQSRRVFVDLSSAGTHRIIWCWGRRDGLPLPH